MLRTEHPVQCLRWWKEMRIFWRNAADGRKDHLGDLGAWREESVAKECESKKDSTEESEDWWEKKSHCVKLDTAGTLRAFLLIVTAYSWETRAKKSPYFNCARAKIRGYCFVENELHGDSCCHPVEHSEGPGFIPFDDRSRSVSLS